MRKRDAFSIIVDSTRNSIIRRLSKAEKAAYSDLLDSAEYVRHLTSTGTFSYHLNFLLENSLIIKDGSCLFTSFLPMSHRTRKDFSENDILKENYIRSGKVNVKENVFYNKGSL